MRQNFLGKTSLALIGTGLLIAASVLSAEAKTPPKTPSKKPSTTPASPATQPDPKKDFTDAMAKSEIAIKHAQESVKSAQASSNALDALTKKKKWDDSALDTLEAITAQIKADDDKAILDNLGNDVRDLPAAKAYLKAAHDKTSSALSAVDRNDFEKEDLSLDDAAKAVDAEIAGLKASLKSASEYPDAIADGLKKQLHGLGTLGDNPADVTLRAQLAADLDKLSVALRVGRGIIADKDDFSDILKSIGHGTPDISGKAIDTLKVTIESLIKSLTETNSPWLHRLSAGAKSENADASVTLAQFIKDPEKFRAEAAVQAKISGNVSADLTTIDTGLKALIVEVKNTDSAPFLPVNYVPDPLITQTAAIEADHIRLDNTVSELNKPYPVNIAQWTADQVNLYYFDDIPRLMKVLNIKAALQGDDTALQATAKQTQEDLASADQDLATAHASVNSARTALQIQRDKVHTAQNLVDQALAQVRGVTNATDAIAKAKAARQVGQQRASTQTIARLQRQADDSQAYLDEAGNRVTLAQGKVDQAQTALTNASDPEAKRTAQSQLDSANKSLDLADNQKIEVEKRHTLLLNKVKEAQSLTPTPAAADTTDSPAVTEAKEDLDTENQKLTAAQAALATAETAESDANKKVQSASAAAALAAFKDNSAFANARDNVPYWYSVPDPADDDSAKTDPIHRVMLYGFPDSKTIFIRGSQNDVDQAKEIIQSFDRPQAQALMTLWTLEISGDTSNNGADRINDALKMVEDNLDISRTYTDHVLDDLRAAIRKNIQPSGSQLAFSQFDIYGRDVQAFYSPDVLASLGGPNFIMPTETEWGNNKYLSGVFPAPSRVTTLAEALIILSFASEPVRRRIRDDFKTSAAESQQRFKKMLQHTYTAKYSDDAQANAAGDGGIRAGDTLKDNDFSHLRWFIGNRPWGCAKQDIAGEGIQRFRQELIYHLQELAVSHVLQFIGQQVQEYAGLKRGIVALGNDNSEEAKSLSQKNATIGKNIENALAWLNNSPKATTQQVVSANNLVIAMQKADAAPTTADAAQNWTALWNEARAFPRWADHHAPDSREAALNETLKEYIRAVDDDLQQAFVDPMLYDLRKQLVQNAHVGVGVFQRTTVLASNRFVARVDPSASSEAALGNTQNILQDTVQLAQFAAAVQTGGTSAVLGGLTGLDRLQQGAQGAPPGLYGITTGNVFQITPVFDPSGQAMRFRFDHVLSSPIREPDGTTNPQLSRIERHSVNTEVQLSNHEIRTISQFDTNQQLGLPTRRQGGIPILRDIPILSDIPLIGWFTRTTGHAAKVQQSLILGQTTMFPTIGDVVDLLTEPVSWSSIDPFEDQPSK